MLFINNRRINSILSTNKYEIGKDLAPQNKNTSHIYNWEVFLFERAQIAPRVHQFKDVNVLNHSI